MKLQPGDKAPQFTATNHTGATVSLADLKGRHLVLYFYPKAFTPGCTTESCDFRDNHRAFRKAGYEILGISPDPPARLAEFRAEYDLTFPLLSDEDHAIAAAYGAWGLKQNYGKEYEGLIRSTIVIDGKGRVEHAWYGIKATGHVERVKRELVTS